MAEIKLGILVYQHDPNEKIGKTINRAIRDTDNELGVRPNMCQLSSDLYDQYRIKKPKIRLGVEIQGNQLLPNRHIHIGITEEN